MASNVSIASGPVTSFIELPNGLLLFSCFNVISVYSDNKLLAHHQLPSKAPIQSLYYSSSLETIFIATHSDLFVSHPSSLNTRFLLSCSDFISSILYTHTLLFIGLANGHIKVFNIADPDTTFLLKTLTPDNSRILYCSKLISFNNYLIFFTGTCQNVLNVFTFPLNLIDNPTITTLTRVASCTGHKGVIFDLDFCISDTFITVYSASDDRRVRCFSFSPSLLSSQFPLFITSLWERHAHSSRVFKIRVGNKGVYSGGEDGKVVKFCQDSSSDDVANDDVMTWCHEKSCPISCLEVQSSGELVAGFRDGSVRNITCSLEKSTIFERFNNTILELLPQSELLFILEKKNVNLEYSIFDCRSKSCRQSKSLTFEENLIYFGSFFYSNSPCVFVITTNWELKIQNFGSNFQNSMITSSIKLPRHGSIISHHFCKNGLLLMVYSKNHQKSTKFLFISDPFSQSNLIDFDLPVGNTTIFAPFLIGHCFYLVLASKRSKNKGKLSLYRLDLDSLYQSNVAFESMLALNTPFSILNLDLNHDSNQIILLATLSSSFVAIFKFDNNFNLTNHFFYNIPNCIKFPILSRYRSDSQSFLIAGCDGMENLKIYVNSHEIFSQRFGKDRCNHLKVIKFDCSLCCFALPCSTEKALYHEILVSNFELNSISHKTISSFDLFEAKFCPKFLITVSEDFYLKLFTVTNDSISPVMSINGTFRVVKFFKFLDKIFVISGSGDSKISIFEFIFDPFYLILIDEFLIGKASQHSFTRVEDFHLNINQNFVEIFVSTSNCSVSCLHFSDKKLSLIKFIDFPRNYGSPLSLVYSNKSLITGTSSGVLLFFSNFQTLCNNTHSSSQSPLLPSIFHDKMEKESGLDEYETVEEDKIDDLTSLSPHSLETFALSDKVEFHVSSELHVGGCNDLVLSSDFLFSIGDGGDLMVWQNNGGSEWSRSGHYLLSESSLRCCCIVDQSFLIVGSWNGDVIVINLIENVVLYYYSGVDQIQSVSANFDSNILNLSIAGNGFLQVSLNVADFEWVLFDKFRI
ncbi:hypothetical protein RCL1_006297 [Eukaryota sp. TZLM3-RCL]